MVESLVVISIMILFFLGMVYFSALYQQKLRVMALARAATVAYGMNGCTGNELGYIQNEMGGTNPNPSGPQAGPPLALLAGNPVPSRLKIGRPSRKGTGITPQVRPQPAGVSRHR